MPPRWRSASARADACAADVAHAGASHRLVQFAREKGGALQLAVTMPASAAPPGEYPLHSWRKVINVKLNGVCYGMR